MSSGHILFMHLETKQSLDSKIGIEKDELSIGSSDCRGILVY
jgi:hypothetical protein